MAKIKLPDSVKKYFWDTDFKEIDSQKNAVYVAERLIELGDLEQLRWLKKTYGLEFLKRIVQKSRNLSQKSANFFSIYFKINPNNILCLQEDYHQKHKIIWNH